MFKTNPFNFVKENKKLDIPDMVIHHKDDFDSYIRKHDSFKTISLDYDQMMKAESNLSVLLEKLSIFY